MMSDRWHSRRVLLAAGIYAALALLCTQIPLLNYLGYESSFVVAIAAALIAGPFTAAAVRRARANATESPATEFVRLLKINLLLLVLPLVVLAGNAFFVKNCAMLEGAAFFLLLPVITAVFSACLGFFCGMHYHRPVLIYFLFMIATAAYAVALGYFTPAIFSYNFFYGFFPGITYDETLEISGSLLVFRLVTLIVAGLLAGMAMLLVRHSSPADDTRTRGLLLLRLLFRPRMRVATVSAVLVLGLIFIFRCELGFESTGSYIRHRLGGVHTTQHFRIYFPAGAYNDEELKRVAAEHEFRLAQLMDEFALGGYGVIESYIYPSPDIKRRLTGAGNTDIAKPWSGEIHTSQQSLDATLKHELAHVVAGEFGMPVIRANTSTGLVEGLAMAMEWNWGNRTLHQYAAALQKFDLAPDITRLMSFTGFAAQSSSVSYVLAGSFCRYLIDRYGIRLMARLYRNADYQAVYGRSLQRLVMEWQSYLDAHVDVGENDRAAMEVLFRQPPIFKKVCARVIAARNKKASELFRNKQYDRAAELFKQSYDEAGGYDALGGYMSSMFRQADYRGVTGLFDSLIAHTDRPDRYLPMFLNAGDAYQALQMDDKATACYEHVYNADFADAYTEAAAVRLVALDDSSTRAPLLRYFLSDASDSTRLMALDSIRSTPLTYFLRGKNLVRLGKMEEASAALAVPLGGSDPFLEAQRQRLLGFTLFRLHRYDEARVAFWLSLNTDDPEAAEDDVNDWIDRCEWMEGNPS